GRVQRLDYKTLRYPGHFEQMRFLADELGLRDHRDELGRLLIRAKPPVADDIVYLHASVEGVKDGQPLRQNHVRGYLPIDLPDGRGGTRRWRAISWTTASSVVGVVDLVAEGRLSADRFVRHEDNVLDHIHTTHTHSRFVDNGSITV